jgi:hypothetical protein
MLSLLPLAPLLVAQPRPFNMNDLSAVSAAGVEVMYGDVDIFTLLGERNVDLLMVHLVGDFAIGPNAKLGVRLPFVYVDCEACFSGSNALDRDDTSFAVGNLTFGGRYVHHAGDVSVGAGGSFSGLTASDDSDDEGTAAFLGGYWSLFRDAGYYLPETTTLRLGGDARFAPGRAFLQAQLALHAYFADEGESFQQDDYTALRLVAGGGFLFTPELSLQGELVMTSLVLDEDDDDTPEIFDDKENFFVLDIGARYETAGVSFGARLSLPLETGQVEDPIGVGVDILARF